MAGWTRFSFTRERPLTSSAVCAIVDTYNLPIACHVLNEARHSVALDALGLFDEAFDLKIVSELRRLVVQDGSPPEASLLTYC
jgi:hypothetical protein